MNAWVLFVVEIVVFVALIQSGRFLLGITPTWQELLLVSLATSFSAGVREGLR